jgi:parallel beta-helix repeat protein
MIKTCGSIFVIICTLFSCLLLLSPIYSPRANAITTNSVTYTENTSNTANPERGFYRNYYDSPIQSELSGYKANKTTMYRTIYDISAFKTSPLSASFLTQINQDAAGFRQAGAKIMPNFKYSDGEVTPNDATKEVILGHLEQLRPYLNNNKDVVTLLPSGFVGNYGEFTISDNNNISFVANEPYIASGNPTLADLANGAGRFVVNQNTRDIVNKILDVLPKERSFTVRQPATKKQLVNSMDPLTDSEAFSQSNKSRLGHQNDSLLGNPLEGATFIYSQDDNSAGRNIEESYYNQDSKFVPHIAETEFFDNGVSGQCTAALQLIKDRHISTINETFNINTLNIWKTQGCYYEIAKKLGYRFVLNNSQLATTVEQNQNFNLKVNLKNDGYATPYNERKLEIILRNNTNGAKYPIDVTNQSDPRLWHSQNSSIDLDLYAGASLPAGDYEVLLNLPDPVESLKNKPDYSIQFSNQNTWEPNTGYNKLNQTLTIVAPAMNNTQYFVAKTGLDTNIGTINSPFATIGHCMQVVVAGDSCNVQDGEYLESNLDTINSGTITKPITIKSVNPFGAVINSTGQATGITLKGQSGANKSNIIIQGFELKNPTYSCLSAKFADHITFIGNKVHDCGGGGIGSNQSDYITITKNIIYRNAFTSEYNESGISLYQNRASDNLPGFHNIISQNLSYSNKNTVPFIFSNPPAITDGNGIIIDDSRNEQNFEGGSFNTPYAQETLVENNIVFDNGGKGIHIFQSDFVTVRNNTVVNNSKTLTGTQAGDLSNVWSSNNKWYNNLVSITPNGFDNSAITNTAYDQTNNNSNNIFKNNLLYNSNKSTTGITFSDTVTNSINSALNIVGQNPKLQDSANINGNPNNFTLLEGSPAINVADNSNQPTVDYFGKNRDSLADIGAVEYFATPANPVTNKVSLLIPFYIYPDGTQNYQEWRNLAAIAQAHPATQITAIISHQGTNIWTDQYARTQFQNGISILKTAGIKVLGYVPSTYSSRPLAELQSQKSSSPSIDSYLGIQDLTGVDGIFVDEMCSGYVASTCNADSYQYYQAVQSKILQAKTNAIIVGNRGGSVADPNYYKLADTIVNFENNQSAFNEAQYNTQASTTKSKNGVLIYNFDQSNQTLINSLLAKAGMMYFTNDNLPNPWDTIASSLNQYLTLFDNYNSPQTVSSSSSSSSVSSSSSLSSSAISSSSKSSSSSLSSSQVSSSNSRSISSSSNSPSSISQSSASSQVNGITQLVEQSGPNGGDANGDGTQDWTQQSVASFPNGTNGQYMVVEAKPNSACKVLTNVGAETTTVNDPNYQYPLGFVKFSSPCNSTIDLKLFFYGLDSNQNYKLRKLNKITNSFLDIPDVVIGSTTIDNKFVKTFEYSVSDQGILDEDRNIGSITDPLGVAQSVQVSGGGVVVITSQSVSSISSSSKPSSISTTVNNINNSQNSKQSESITSSEKSLSSTENQNKLVSTIRTGGMSDILIIQFLVALTSVSFIIIRLVFKRRSKL